MSFLIGQMLVCLLLASLLGFLIGWALRALVCHNKISELEESWKKQLAAAGAPVKRDDLKVIEGIGPKIEKLLNKDEIYTWEELAQAPLDRLRKILSGAGEHYRIHDPKSWPDQAKLASEGRWEELDELQEVLLGGRST